MKPIKLSAAAIVAALLPNLSYADVPVTNLSTQSTVTSITAPSSADNSSASQAKSDALTVASFETNSNLTPEQRVKRLEQMFIARGQSQIKLRQQVNQLSDQVAQLNGTIEQQQHQIDQMTQRERDIYQEMDRRFAQLKASQASDSSQASNANSGPVTSGKGEADYEKAVQLVLQDRKFDQAISAFGLFLKQYPQSPYVPNAHYWLGQLQYTQGQQDQAIQEFSVVVNQYPKSNKVPESLLKLGQIALQKNQNAKATDYFNQVVKNYPQSSAADLAKAQLKTVKK
ncbi:tol-pal system protein YbgF [Celerinatantimonas yamalensis]|uniref:Cell division coordinator CpoB n=1 Tax=Celerinatantimonas yamalensis TaxID=559956 RepID=A0ABW9G6Z7_9GAMM